MMTAGKFTPLVVNEITLHDWFAGQALTAYIQTIHSSPEAIKAFHETRTASNQEPDECIAAIAYQCADAMMVVRKQRMLVRKQSQQVNDE